MVTPSGSGSPASESMAFRRKVFSTVGARSMTRSACWVISTECVAVPQATAWYGRLQRRPSPDQGRFGTEGRSERRATPGTTLTPLRRRSGMAAYAENPMPGLPLGTQRLSSWSRRGRCSRDGHSEILRSTWSDSRTVASATVQRSSGSARHGQCHIKGQVACRHDGRRACTRTYSLQGRAFVAWRVVTRSWRRVLAPPLTDQGLADVVQESMIPRPQSHSLRAGRRHGPKR